ncbi:hypothetical protein ACFS27_13945 [Promicromonospora vindobonensis]|uniref:Uncharacterized protein n=1 Tax=Promicromonospora vindobonensis TaxID=195748 RepID=A0ABW5VTR1_9MICO
MITSRDVPTTQPEQPDATPRGQESRTAQRRDTAQGQSTNEVPDRPSNAIAHEAEKRLPRSAYGAALLGRVNAVVHPDGAGGPKRRVPSHKAPVSERVKDQFEQPTTPAAVGSEYEG